MSLYEVTSILQTLHDPKNIHNVKYLFISYVLVHFLLHSTHHFIKINMFYSPLEVV